MSQILTIAKPAAEEVKKFNQRLRDACSSMPVTSFECVLADGEPVITLISEMEEADEEDVKESDGDVALGDLIPESNPIELQVMRIGTAGTGAALAEDHTERLNKRADGAVEEVRYITGTVTDWVRDRNDFDKEGAKEISSSPHWVKIERQAVYAVVAYLAAFEEEPATAGAGVGAKTVRK